MMEVLMFLCGVALGAGAVWWLLQRRQRRAAMQTGEAGKNVHWEMEDENARLHAMVEQLSASLRQTEASMQEAIGQWEAEQRAIELTRQAERRADDRIAGYFFLGAASRPLDERPRPETDTIVRKWPLA